MGSTQELTRRIKSVTSTRKATRAMQMISASKMRRSQNANVAGRMYAAKAIALFRALNATLPGSDSDKPLSILTNPHISHFLYGNKESSRVLIVVISTNRGFVGSFNTNLFVKLSAIQKEHEGASFEYITMGRKAAGLAVRFGQHSIADFPKEEVIARQALLRPLTKLTIDAVRDGNYKAVYVVYNHFVSTLSQEARVRALIPMALPVVDDVPAGEAFPTEYLLEPDPEALLMHVLPKLIENQLYQALLESDASEHSARMIMMKNATESAHDLIADLTLTYNQLRQNKITTELSEITAGKIALEDTI